MNPKSSYTGVDLLKELNDGLFEELDANSPVVRLYRRELQRNYVMLLLIGVGAASDPQEQSAAPQSEQPGTPSPKPYAQAERSAQWLSSPLADRLQFNIGRPRSAPASSARPCVMAWLICQPRSIRH